MCFRSHTFGCTEPTCAVLWADTVQEVHFQEET